MIRSAYQTTIVIRIFYGWTTTVGLGLLTDRFPNHSDKTHPVGTPLDEWSACRRELYLTIHNTHKRQTSTPSAGIELAIPGSERLQTHALDRAATGIGRRKKWDIINWETRIVSYTYKIAKPTYWQCSSRLRILVQPVLSVTMTHRLICATGISNWAPAALLLMVKPLWNRPRICIL